MILHQELRAPSLRVGPELKETMCQLQQNWKQVIVQTNDGGNHQINKT